MMPITAAICPYPGLRSFSEDESIYFKGRETHIEKCIELIRQNKFLMLTGASGDGKSSLVFAGVIPNAKAGFFTSRFARWLVVDFRPERQPVENLAKALSHEFNADANTTYNMLKSGFSSLVDFYVSSPFFTPEVNNGAVITAQERKAASKKSANLLIVIDQFEELFTHPDNFSNAQLSANAKTLVNLVIETNRICREKNIPIHIICTMRSDYIGYCSSFNSLPELIGKSHYFIPRMNRSEIYRVIIEPAVLSGDKITPRLIERLLYDLKEGIDILPVLQHAMFRIWKMAKQNGTNEPMDLLHYAMAGGMPEKELPGDIQPLFQRWFSEQPEYKKRLLDNPSLENILNAHADELYETAHLHYNEKNKRGEISSEQAKKIIKRTFQCLAKMDEEKCVRSRMSLSEICGVINDAALTPEKLTDVFGIYSFEGNTLIRPFNLSRTKNDASHEKISSETVVEITHEALIRNWKNLRQWVKEEDDSMELFSDFFNQLNRWKQDNKARKYLLSEGQYHYFSSWFNEHNPSVAWIKMWLRQYGYKFAMPQSNTNVAEPAEKINADARQFLTESKKMIHAKKNMIRAGVVVIISLLFAFAFAFFNANKQTSKAELAATISKSNEIALRALMQVDADPTLAFRVAEAAFNVYPTSRSKQAILQSYNNQPFYSRTLAGHTSIVNFALFSPDGKRILTVSNDKTARLWDSEGQSLKVLDGHTEAVMEGFFSNDGNYMLTRSLDNTACLWTSSGELLQVYNKHNAGLHSARFSPDGKFVVTSGADSTVKIWDVKGHLLHTIKGQAEVFSARYANGGNAILTSSSDNTAKLWEVSASLNSGLKVKVIKTFQSPGVKIKYAKFLHHPENLATYGGDGKIIIWNTNGKILKTFSGDGDVFEYVQFSSDDKFLAARSSGNAAYLWNMESGEKFALRGHKSTVKHLSFSHDNKYLVTVGEDLNIRMWNMNGTLFQILKPNDFTYSAEFSPDGKYLVTSHNVSVAKLWRIENLTNLTLAGHNGFIWESDISPDGNHIATASWDSTARLWDKNGNLFAILDGHKSKVHYALFSPDKKHILTAAEDGTAILWNFNGEVIKIMKAHEKKLSKPCFSPDEKHIIIPSSDKTISLWGIDGNLIQKFIKHSSGINTVAFSPDNEFFVSGSSDNTAILWNINFGYVNAMKGHKAGVRKVAFSHDGKHIVTASDDGTARLWDLNGNEIAIFRGHQAEVRNLAFSNDDKYLATVSNDQTVRLWDLTGKQLQVYYGHSVMINTIFFSSDDKYMLTSADDATARLWDLHGNEIAIYSGHKDVVQDAKFFPDGKFILTSSGDGTARIWPLFAEDVLKKVNVEKESGDVWQLDDKTKKTFGIEGE